MMESVWKNLFEKVNYSFVCWR